MANLHTLTVQDILWINLQVSKRVNHYNFAKLEEATFYQYAYGESKDLVAQAARFIPGFIKMKPFEAANEATAFVAGVAFLELNGRRVCRKDSEALDWFDMASDRATALDAIVKNSSIEHDDHGHTHEISPREAIESVLKEYENTIEKLVGRCTAAVS